MKNKIEIDCTRCKKHFILENDTYHLMIRRHQSYVGENNIEGLEGPFGYEVRGFPIDWLCPQCEIELIENFAPHYDYLIPKLKENINVQSKEN